MNQLKKIKLFTHSIVLSLFPIIYLYAHNIDQMPFRYSIQALIWSLSVTVLMLLLVNIKVKNIERTSIYISLLLLVFYSYGRIHTFFYDVVVSFISKYKILTFIPKFDETNLYFHSIVLTLSISILLIATIRVRKTYNLNNVRIFANIFSTALLMFAVINIVKYHVSHEEYISPYSKLRINSTQKINVDLLPDIYYFILDGYARDDILLKQYNYDNSTFLNKLQEKGFFIAKNSHANYSWTFLSLPSSLNFTYLDDEVKDMINSNERDRLYRMIKDNRVMKFLKSYGYTYLHLKSSWIGASDNKFADKEIGYHDMLFENDFTRVLSETTILKLFSGVLSIDLAHIHLENFKILESVPDDPSPTFTFSHILLPHHPY